ncbi:hypothetical protein SAMN04488104_101776 [Algoriphagus faecimaris]|uniref:NVEALA protein n=1 Tax=Algoriphagus faecimaris TaxID=686796 RepID=A0A1G6SL70_9BACT|nr:hypothetical protein [Algoriphagus faecimaris]SDD17588.1 hypothetical protein SAMN04488104_101776 [Algoriphagus faecimaris]
MKKLKVLSIVLCLGFIGILGIDLSVSTNHGTILGALTSNSLAQATVVIGGEGCPPCGPLMGNAAVTRYCCADTNSDACAAARC